MSKPIAAPETIVPVEEKKNALAGAGHGSGMDCVVALVPDRMRPGVWRTGLSIADSDAGRKERPAECDLAQLDSIPPGARRRPDRREYPLQDLSRTNLRRRRQFQ